MAASQPLFLAAILAAAAIFSVQAQQVVRVRGRPRTGLAKSFAPVPTVPLVNISKLNQSFAALFCSLATDFVSYTTLFEK